MYFLIHLFLKSWSNTFILLLLTRLSFSFFVFLFWVLSIKSFLEWYSTTPFLVFLFQPHSHCNFSPWSHFLTSPNYHIILPHLQFSHWNQSRLVLYRNISQISYLLKFSVICQIFAQENFHDCQVFDDTHTFRRSSKIKDLSANYRSMDCWWSYAVFWETICSIFCWSNFHSNLCHFW